MRTRTVHLLLTFLMGFLSLMGQSCTSAKTPTPTKDNFPQQIDYPNYELVDARHTVDLTLNAKQNTRMAIIVRDLAVTAYSNLEKPVYDKKIVEFEGADHCCVPNNGMIGSTGLMVYRFHFLRKGNTTIELIARHKGLSTTTPHFDNDIVTTIKLNID